MQEKTMITVSVLDTARARVCYVSVRAPGMAYHVPCHLSHAADAIRTLAADPAKPPESLACVASAGAYTHADASWASQYADRIVRQPSCADTMVADCQ